MTTEELIVYEKIRDFDREAARRWRAHLERGDEKKRHDSNSSPPSMTPPTPLQLLKDLRLTF